MIDLYQYENELYKKGIKYIAGVDEVGRGPLVGPVVTACVVLPNNFVLEGLNDSKKLSEKKRDIYYDIIMKEALGIGIGIVDEKEIDRINILQASKKAMIEAINNVSCKIDHVLIDAMKLDINIPSTSIIKGDSKSITIAAASVIAKVTRDKMMYELDKEYPMYGFAKHKGYPTKFHLAAIKKHGILDNYRMTYGPVKEIINLNKNKEFNK
ncbi:MAG: ribonuclease HII [Bacilli bacterium]|nr:ribonuclease HII [Bacilli bacterium]